MKYHLLRSALCLAMFAICFAMLQCTANDSSPKNEEFVIPSQRSSGRSSGLPLNNSGNSYFFGFAFNYSKTGENKYVFNISGSSRNASFVVNSLATTTKKTTGTSDGQEITETKDTSGDSGENRGKTPSLKQTATDKNPEHKTTNSQTTAPETSVQILNSTFSNAVSKGSTQTSANSTNELAKGDSTATAKRLSKLSNARQSADNKDGNFGCSSVFAFSAFATFVVMAVALFF